MSEETDRVRRGHLSYHNHGDDTDEGEYTSWLTKGQARPICPSARPAWSA